MGAQTTQVAVAVVSAMASGEPQEEVAASLSAMMAWAGSTEAHRAEWACQRSRAGGLHRWG